MLTESMLVAGVAVGALSAATIALGVKVLESIEHKPFRKPTAAFFAEICPHTSLCEHHPSHAAEIEASQYAEEVSTPLGCDLVTAKVGDTTPLSDFDDAADDPISSAEIYQSLLAFVDSR